MMKVMPFSPVAFAALLLAPFATASFVTNPASLNANDTIVWSQLGTSGSLVSSSFQAASTSRITLHGSFNLSSGGTVGVVCPAANCNFAAAPGFNSGDSLLWTEDSLGNGTGPLLLSFSTPVRGFGFYFQLTAPATFSASLVEIAGANSSSEIMTSDSAGDPIFVGALDPQPDITGLQVSGLSCTPSSPGGCSTSDFAIDTVSLTTVPEPTTIIMMLLAPSLLALRQISHPGARRRLRWRMPSLLCAVFVVATGASLRAQDPVPIPSDEALPIDINNANLTSSTDANVSPQPNTAEPSLPIWRYQLSSPITGFTYSGYMVGTSPFNRGARTIILPVILVPFVISFQNTTSGFSATFDPSTAPDTGCTAGQTAMSLVENSPIFQSQDWTLNGVYVGNTQYIDAYQRANFWQYVQNTGNAYHVLLNFTVGDPLLLSLQYASPALAAEVRVGVQSPCTNPSVSGSTNGGNYQGVVDFATLQNAMTGYITSHGITPDKFPIFIVYNVMYSQNGLLYLGGYHFSTATYPQALTSPGQTFALANFRTNGTPPYDVSILSHEIAEWINDPGGFNAVPAWGNIGEVTGCKRNLEVGDPLTRTDLPAIAGPNGFAYHLQELAFFSWFFRTASFGAGAIFSDNGTLTSDAGSVCQ
jgi:hypothetical protein